jgi:hypothetical protein
VKRLLRAGRELNARFAALVNHYLFEPCFARPYHGDDKGGVEARGGAIRRQHLTPIPEGASLEDISASLLARVEQESQGKERAHGRTVLECFVEERPRMLSLPSRPYRVERVVPVSLTRSAIARVEGAVYSVPCAWKMLSATAYVGLHNVRIVCRGEEVEHPRQQFGGRSVRQRHYLPEFAKKPQAVRQNAVELLAELGEPYGRLWRLLVDAHGPRDAARLMAGVVGAIVEHGEEPIASVVADALRRDQLDLLQLANLREKPATNAVPDALAHHTVEVARAADFDHLLLEDGHE